jgi:class 3 adenylate cyclase
LPVTEQLRRPVHLKPVTALFADIQSSTELMSDLDPEEARAIVDPVLRLMMAAVHRYGGYVAQSTGDGIFALFGAPVAHEDHPQRALHAALAMQEELHRYADRLRSQGKIPVEARVGVNTGEVVELHRWRIKVRVAAQNVAARGSCDKPAELRNSP